MDQTRADGTYVEGNAYGLGTLGSALASYHAAARCLGVPARELVFERALACLRFSRDIEQTISPLGAAFAAGLLGDDGFRDQCVPSSALADIFGKRNWAEFGVLGLDALWAHGRAGRGAAAAAAVPCRHTGTAAGCSCATPTPGQPGGHAGKRPVGPARPHLEAQERRRGERLGRATLLLHRFHHVAYLDSRYEHTARTAAYNTLTPGGRSQDEGRAGAGARLLMAADAGVFAATESDAASAWEGGVEQALRRLLLIRPDLLIVDDTAAFGAEEPAVLSWHSLTPWRVDSRSCAARSPAGASRARHDLRPGPGRSRFELSAAQDAVHRIDGGDHVPAWRAAFATPAGRRHRLLSVVQTAPPGAGLPPPPSRLDTPGARGGS